MLILALLMVSPVLSSQTSSPAPQVQPTMMKAVEKKSTEPSTCYAVQVGAYEDRAQGQAMLNKLTPAFPEQMTLTQVVTRGKTRWRLRLQATSKVEALNVSGRMLGEQGIKAWIDAIPCTIPLAAQSQDPNPHRPDNREFGSSPRSTIPLAAQSQDPNPHRPENHEFGSSPRSNIPLAAQSQDNDPPAMDSSELGSFLGTFGAEVPRWKATISTVDVSSLSVSNEESKQIEQWRNLSLECLDFVRNDTVRLSTKVSLSDQIRLLDDLNRLASNVSGLGNSLSYLATPQQARDIPKAQQWARALLDVTREIFAEYQKFYLHLLALAASIDSPDDKSR